MTLPDPDPTWDYSQLYQHLSFAKDALDRAIASVSKEEEANDATDSVLLELLETLQSEALKAINCLHHKPDLSAFDTLSPEYKEKWQYILDNHPWIIRE
jgi:molecular chaperone GrpE (heat shock protein)